MAAENLSKQDAINSILRHAERLTQEPESIDIRAADDELFQPLIDRAIVDSQAVIVRRWNKTFVESHSLLVKHIGVEAYTNLGRTILENSGLEVDSTILFRIEPDVGDTDLEVPFTQTAFRVTANEIETQVALSDDFEASVLLATLYELPKWGIDITPSGNELLAVSPRRYSTKIKQSACSAAITTDRVGIR